MALERERERGLYLDKRDAPMPSVGGKGDSDGLPRRCAQGALLESLFLLDVDKLFLCSRSAFSGPVTGTASTRAMLSSCPGSTPPCKYSQSLSIGISRPDVEGAMFQILALKLNRETTISGSFNLLC